MSDDSTLEGGCLCGALRYRVGGEPVVAALCHCTMCRRASAAPMVAWAMYPQARFELTAGDAAVYASSPGAERRFCARCGTQIAFAADYLPGLVDITIGSLDDPSAVAPALHYWESKRLPWVQLNDGLPRHAEFPPIAPSTGDAPPP